jgi:two-component system NarL family sensor kinase
VVPEAYGAVRFTALFLVAVHAHFGGERIGLALAAGTAIALVGGTAIRGDAGEVNGDLLAFYEAAFAASALATGVIVGRLRTTESASRLRARGLTRRTLQGESDVRRQVAEALHDGPVQELIALDMTVTAMGRAVERGDSARAHELLAQLHGGLARNVQALRDEIVDLGPYAFEELSLDMALGKSLAVWRRRYDQDVRLIAARVELDPEAAEDLFRIAQEAVANAARHSGASTVEVTLRTVDGQVELRVTDDGKGFGPVDPLGRVEPGHLGMAGIRERVEMLQGELRIDTSGRGTRLVVRAPRR